MKKLLSKQGFTLIELLIVIVIIGILAAAFLPNILSAPARARDAGRQGDLNKLVAAIEVFNADNGHYPAGVSGGGCIHGGTTPGVDAADLAIFKTYFPAGVPMDPDNNADIGGCTDGGGYFYCELDGTAGNYILAAFAETDTANADGANAVLISTGCNGGATGAGTLFDTQSGAYAILN